MHLVGGAVGAADFEPAEAAFEVGEELAESRAAILDVVGIPVVAELKLRIDTGDEAVVQRAFGLDVDVAGDEGNLRVLEGRAADVIRVDDVEAGDDVAADRNLQRVARERRAGEKAER